MQRLLRMLATAALVAGSLSGCALLTSSVSCAEYSSLPTPQERFDAAQLVVVAKVAATDRIAHLDADYPIYRASVTRVLKGATSQKAIDVVATSDQCTTSGKPPEYLDGDPLAKAGTVILYLANPDDGVRKLTAPGAVDELSADGTLPFSLTPTPTPTSSGG